MGPGRAAWHWVARLILAAALVLAPLTVVPSTSGIGTIAAVALAGDGDSGGGRGRGRGGDVDDDDDGDDDDGDDAGNRGRGRGGSDQSDYRGGILRIEVSSSGIEVRYVDGSRERIERGRYEFRDAAGRTVERRRATGADVSRLRALSENAAVRGAPGARLQDRSLRALSVRGGDIRVDYTNGWSEEIRSGTYRLIDAFGRIVVHRPATEEDRVRMLAGAS
jgi:hypothetical protein